MVKQLERAFATTAFILVMGLYSGMAGAHGKVSLEQDTCVRGTQGSMVHLSMYQPLYAPFLYISATTCTFTANGHSTPHTTRTQLYAYINYK
jgi:hypothetical protein